MSLGWMHSCSALEAGLDGGGGAWLGEGLHGQFGSCAGAWAGTEATVLGWESLGWGMGLLCPLPLFTIPGSLWFWEVGLWDLLLSAGAEAEQKGEGRRSGGSG